MNARDFDDPVYSLQDMERPRPEEVAALVEVLRKKAEFERVNLYAEPAYARSVAVELYIVEDWQRANDIREW